MRIACSGELQGFLFVGREQIHGGKNIRHGLYIQIIAPAHIIGHTAAGCLQPPKQVRIGGDGNAIGPFPQGLKDFL